MTAWLGLFAMWLIVFAPIVSQGLEAYDRNTPFASICSADGQPDAGGHALAAHLDACAYCDLLAHHVPAPSPVLPQLQTAGGFGIVQPSASPALVHRDIFPSARPRDSPLLVF
ncbi:DUF2946 domain-containing protein [Burkholderia cepacia]|uniref:DUF2946 domain-containing protein n=1 Tax=Burkholderia cepacia TaxID=292 RepID=UPI00069CDD27|nr:DUF2946 domain-containing protein [Burkholderia cepacia]